MSIVRAVHGIVEPNPVKPVNPADPLVSAVDAEGKKDQPPTDRVVPAARQGYEEHNRNTRPSKPAMLARDIMTAPVLTLPSDSTLAEAWAIMTRRSFRHLPITSFHGALVGMVSDRDLIRHVPELVTNGASTQAAGRRLAEIMSPRVLSATPTTDIRDIARVMMEERVGALPILGPDRRPVGIVSKQDLLRSLANHGPLELWT